ncbi:MAG: hypothetical protein MHM6MM_001056 [Cercozoa sp. M6MM]
MMTQKQRKQRKRFRALRALFLVSVVALLGVLQFTSQAVPTQRASSIAVSRTESKLADTKTLAPRRNDTDFTDAEECAPLDVASELRCQFVSQAKPCVGNMALIPYLQLHFCDLSPAIGTPTSLFLLLFLLLSLFLALGNIAEDFFSPTVAALSDLLALSESVAGVTLLAFGNGAPDLFSSFSALTGDTPQLGAGAMFGAAVFVPLVVMGSVSWVVNAKAGEVETDEEALLEHEATESHDGEGTLLQRWPLLRDFSFLCLSVSVVYSLIAGGNQVPLIAGVLVLSLYVVYVGVVIVGERYQALKQIENDEEQDEVNLVSPLIFGEHSRRHTLSTQSFDGALLQRSSTYDFAEQDSDLEEDVLASGWTSALRPHDIRLVLLDDDVTEDEEETESADTTRTLGYYGKKAGAACWHGMQWPVLFLCRVTIPLLDRQHTKRIRTTALQLLCSPFFVALVFAYSSWVALLAAACVGAAGAAIGSYALLARRKRCLLKAELATSMRLKKRLEQAAWNGPLPKALRAYLLLLAMLSSVAWIYMVANELVALLSTLGAALGIGAEVLGLTVLAWGNSIGDVVADLVLARSGFAQMAIAASAGGPLLNVLIGFGMASLLQAAKGTPISISPVPRTVHVAAIVAALVAASHAAVVGGFFKGRLTRQYASFTFLTYGAFVVFSVFIALNVF